jgi:hypothetical protein
MFLTFKLITCLIDGFPLKMNSQSIAFLLTENEHTYWILNLEKKMHSIWIIWKRLSRMQRQFYFLKTYETYNNFRLGFEKHRFFCEGYPKVPDRGAPTPIHLPPKVCRENRKCHSMCAWTRQDMKQYHVDLFKHVHNSQTHCRTIMYSH